MVANARRRTQELVQELTSNPFFPLLFISELTKTSAFWLVGESSTNAVGISFVMAVISVVGWLYTYEEVQWGICKAQEVVDEATDDDHS